MNNAKLAIRRLRRLRSDRVLRWVFPSVKQYTIATWRRVNPRYDMSGGDFDGINEFQLVEVQYARTRLGAIFVQAIMGRDKWTDGFRQQVIEIIEPGDKLGYVLKWTPPSVSFDDYPTSDKPDLIPDVDENPYADKVPPKFVE